MTFARASSGSKMQLMQGAGVTVVDLRPRYVRNRHGGVFWYQIRGNYDGARLRHLVAAVPTRLGAGTVQASGNIVREASSNGRIKAHKPASVSNCSHGSQARACPLQPQRVSEPPPHSCRRRLRPPQHPPPSLQGFPRLLVRRPPAPGSLATRSNPTEIPTLCPSALPLRCLARS